MPVPGRRKITIAVIFPLFVAALEVVALMIIENYGIKAVEAGTTTIAEFI